MQWIDLIFADIFEVSWAILMKLSHGFTISTYTIGTIIDYILSAVFLSMSLKRLPLGTAYAMWTGFGIIGTTLFGILFFHETLNLAKCICIAFIICGIARLKLIG